MIDQLQSAFAAVTPAAWRILLIVLAAAGLGLGLSVRPLLRRRMNRDLLRHLGDSTRSRLTLDAANARGDFHAHFDPAPEPFSRLHIVRIRAPLAGPFTPARRGTPRGFMRIGRTQSVDQLRLEGTLPKPPVQELLWAGGQIPSRPLLRGEGVGLWMQQQSDLTGSEYVTRGDNVAPLQHALFELQRRYYPFLQQLVIQTDATPHIVATLVIAHGLNAESMPALVGLLRTAGRAAQRP